HGTEQVVEDAQEQQRGSRREDGRGEVGARLLVDREQQVGDAGDPPAALRQEQRGADHEQERRAERCDRRGDGPAGLPLKLLVLAPVCFGGGGVSLVTRGGSYSQSSGSTTCDTRSPTASTRSSAGAASLMTPSIRCRAR